MSERYTFNSASKVLLSFGGKYLISDEFIRVECLYESSATYLEFHSFLPKKPEVLTRVLNESQKNQGEKLSVMILGIDTMSRLNFHRLMKKSKLTLEKIGGIEFFGYNKVGK